LVNKFLREKLEKEEKKFNTQENLSQQPGNEISERPSEDSDSILLLNNEIFHERSLVRCLLEYGLNEWEDGKKVADYLLYEFIDDETVEDTMLKKIINTYKIWYEENLEPTSKSFLYSDDLAMSNIVVHLIEFPYEVSDGWETKYEMPVPTREGNYKMDIDSTIRYLDLKKIKKLISENADELGKTTSLDRQIFLMQTHARLKEMEMQLSKAIGMVIMK
jgi:DNA primase